jgi:hypothetical protein
MTNLQTIVILLQAILGLLSNPATATNPQVQALATQVITEVAQMLATPDVANTTVSIVTSTPAIVINVTPAIGSPDLGAIAPPVQPSCTLLGTMATDGVSFTWADTGATNGSISVMRGKNAGQVIWDTPSAILSASSSNSSANVAPDYVYRASFNDGAVCYTFFTQDQLGQTDASRQAGYPMVGDVSTSTNLYGFIL